MVRTGVVTDIVCEVAEDLKASVIVMATHGRSGLSHLVLGSTTENILRKAPCPVLVVRPPEEASKPRRKKSASRRK